MGYCSICGEWTTAIRRGRCNKCLSRIGAEHQAKKIQDGIDNLADWRALILKQPKTTLTNDQWLEACKYFGGCAYCGDPEIASRSMFIPFKYGGLYTAWNIIPSCEKCETMIKLRPNPFIRLNRSLNRDKRSVMRKNGYDRDTLSNITKYLQSKMEETDESR